MSDADDAYKVAQRLIAEVLVDGRSFLDLELEETNALNVLPPEISELTWIIELYLDDTQITDLSPLVDMKGLEEIYLDNTQVTDLSPLTGMKELTKLWLDNTQVADLRPLIALTKLTHEFGGLTFRNTPATKLDPKLAELSEIEDPRERTARTFAYLREVGDDWPPMPANLTPITPQTDKGFRYAPTDDGPIGYNSPAATTEPTSQLAQLHSMLHDELKKFLKSDPVEGEFHQRLVDKVAAYQTNLGNTVNDLVPIMVWKSGNDLRIELNEAKEQQTPTINTPPLDVDRRTALESLVTLHNAFASLHPEIAELDVVGVDPADRHVSELTHRVLSNALSAFDAQVLMLMEDVRGDLQDLHAEAMTDGKAALRALNLEDESLQNLIKAIVAEAVLETQGGGILSKIGGDVRGAVVGGAVGAATTAFGPEVAANYTQLVTALEPYMAQLITAWHGPNSNIKDTIDWVMLRLRMNSK